MKKVTSVFSNVGVGEAYLEEVGFKVSVACELDKLRCEVYDHLYGVKPVCGDVTDDGVFNTLVERAAGSFLLIATPPCQGFSTLNPKGGGDPRNKLIYTTFELINKSQPPYALVENVPQMIKAFENKDIAAAISQALPDYDYKHGILDAVDFDTPQQRKRAIVQFTRKGCPTWHLPPPRSSARISLWEAIGGLPSLESGEGPNGHPWHFAQKHSANHVEWLKHTPTGYSAFENNVHYPKVVDKETNEIRRIKAFSNTYKRMRWDAPAPTLIRGAHMISSCNTVHPGRPLPDGTYSDARTLSICEAMIVMGLPGNWQFPNLSYTQAMNFLGEGLCPKLVKALVENLPR